MINSVEAAKHLFIGQRTAVNSRPIFHVFHKQVSKTVTSIGTSPWDQSCKNRRKVAATALNLVKIRRYYPILNLEAREFLRELEAESANGTADVDFRQLVKRFSLNLVLTLNYGTRISQVKYLKDDPLLAEIIYVESEISKLRDTANNYANYIPILRYIGPLASLISKSSSPTHAADIGKRRLGYNSWLLSQLKSRVSRGEDEPCIQGTVLRDPESATLSEAELISVSFSMMAVSTNTCLFIRFPVSNKIFRARKQTNLLWLGRSYFLLIAKISRKKPITPLRIPASSRNRLMNTPALMSNT